MSFLANESLIFISYSKFGIQWYITCLGIFWKRISIQDKFHEYPIFTTKKNDVTLNIIKVKYTINLQIIPFRAQNKTQIASNTHRYKKIVKKTLT